MSTDGDVDWNPEILNTLLEYVERIDVQIDETVVTNVVRLSQYFLADFTPHGQGQWLALEDKLELVQMAMRGITALMVAVERDPQNVSLSAEAVSALVHALVGFSSVLSTWLDTVQSDTRSVASVIYQDTANKTVFFLRVLGGRLPTDFPGVEHISRLRYLFCGTIRVASLLFNDNTSLSFPVFFVLVTDPCFLSENQLQSQDAQMSMIKFDNPRVAYNFLSHMLHVWATFLETYSPAEWYISDFSFQLTQYARVLFEQLLSSACAMEPAPRVRLLLIVLNHAKPLIKMAGLTFDWNHILLRHRLTGGNQSGWNSIDDYLISSFQAQDFTPLCEEEFADILSAFVKIRSSPTISLLAFSFVYANLQHMDLALVLPFTEIIQRIDFGGRHGVIVELMNQRANSQLSMSSLSVHSDSQYNWRIRARAALHVVLRPEEINWMDDDESIDDKQYMQRILNDTTAKLTKRASKPADWRLQMISNVQALLVTLTPTDTVSALPLYQAFMKMMLGGTENETTVEVRRQAFRCAARIVERDQFDAEENNVDVFTAVFSGLNDVNRSVRMAAGTALYAVVVCLTKVGPKSLKLLEDVFHHLHAIADGAKLTCKESLTISVGQCGEINDRNVLALVLCFLISQLRRPNPIIKAEAACQILKLTKHYHKKTPWPLFSPHMEIIAPFLIFQEAQFLSEYCKLMGITTRDFFDRTQRHTIPLLMAKCDSQLLSQVAAELEKAPSRLIMDGMDRVLGRIFMIDNAAAYQKALQFTVDILSRDAAKGDDITAASVVKGFINPLLAYLVVVMGDQDAQVVSSAQTAIKRVAKAVIQKPSQPGKSQAMPDLGSFLSMYMLALMTHLNDMLQAVQGRINITTKQKVLRSLGVLIRLIGTNINSYAPQIMATLQTNVAVPDVSTVALEVWSDFLQTLAAKESSAYFGTTSATIVYLWPTFSFASREVAFGTLDYMINSVGSRVEGSLNDLVDFSDVPELAGLHRQLQTNHGLRSHTALLTNILERAESPNYAMAIQSLRDLKKFMSDNKDFMYALTSGDAFDPIVGKILVILVASASRDGDGAETMRLLAFECFGILGAVDPDRIQIPSHDTQMVLSTNFADEEESFQFALHLIKDLLVAVFRSTSDTKYQGHLAYGIQELLKFCGFTTALVVDGLPGKAPSMKIRNRWNELPKHVLETVTPLLGGRFVVKLVNLPPASHPFYPHHSTYRDWIQVWTTYLISQVKHETAKAIFKFLQPAVHNNDVVVAHHLLPHLVLHNLISGSDEVVDNIRIELIVVLDDQVNHESTSSSDKRLLSAQAVFMLLDHLNKWIRRTRQGLVKKKADKNTRTISTSSNPTQLALTRVESILSSINRDLMAMAALQCKSYALSLMNFERQVDMLSKINNSHQSLPGLYERLHEIYAQLDEPDGMEGVSAMILSPTLEHQIRQHESMGRWTSAQSCWEVRLQQSPDNLDFHIGLLRCLRNLGHYDTLATHVRGVLTRHPTWSSALSGFQVESAWMVCAWDAVKKIVDEHDDQSAELAIARVLLAIKAGDHETVEQALSTARTTLGTPIAAAGRGYRSSYGSVLNLHVIHELEAVYRVMLDIGHTNSQRQKKRELAKFSESLQARLEATLPTFRAREPILSMRRMAFRLFPDSRDASVEAANTWLASAKIARKAGQWQTAYSALLQAKQGEASHWFMESSKLTKATGDPIRAIQELENSMQLLSLIEGPTSTIDLTEDPESISIKAKAHVLRSRWTAEAQRCEQKIICEMFAQARNIRPNWESSQFHYGNYQDECFKSLPTIEQIERQKDLSKEQIRDRKINLATRAAKMNVITIQCFAQAMKYGSKYVFQTVPRLLTLWISVNALCTTEMLRNRRAYKEADALAQSSSTNLKRLKSGSRKAELQDEIVITNSLVKRLHDANMELDKSMKAVAIAVPAAIREVPVYQWYTAFPQIVSRIAPIPLTATADPISKPLAELVTRVLKAYPAQAIWLFISATKSKNEGRKDTACNILWRILNDPGISREARAHITECQTMSEQLLALCQLDAEIPKRDKPLSMAEFPYLQSCARPDARLIIPLQESLTAILPPSSSKFDAAIYQPFPLEMPTFVEFMNEIQIMSSLAKPKKITVRGSNNQMYMFLGKPKDDLRKDARLMDFNSIINKLLNSNSESRRRQLHIRTYGVVTLNEECGFIQWVPNTITLRPILTRYLRQSNNLYHLEIQRIETEKMSVKQALPVYRAVLADVKPVLHDWFLETFPEPTAWLASRMSYGRTLAVMSIVGFILGLGDRHTDNILLDVNNGDVIHVDFNCLFEKGKNLSVAELVPFRLTQNLINGLGVTGVEGVFRISCELTYDILRNNKDPLMSVLDAFIHDPLGEFEEARLKMQSRRERAEDPTQKALVRVGNKLMGMHTPNTLSEVQEVQIKEMSTKNLVQSLILEATNESNLAMMFNGWGAWL